MKHCKCCYCNQKKIMERYNIEKPEQKELNNQELTTLVMSMANKINELEQTIAKLETNNKRKRIKNIQDILKEKKPSQSFTEWLKHIEITQVEFELLNDFTYVECVFKVLKKRFAQKNLPFSSFAEKKAVYVYQEEWREITTEELKKIMNKMFDCYNDKYFKWSESINQENERNKELSCFYICKIDCSETLKESKLNELKRLIQTELSFLYAC